MVLNSNILKLIAIIFMTIDHIGLFFSSNILRILGRISFPLFAFQVSISMKKTRNKSKYIFKLLLYAVITQIIFIIVFRNTEYFNGLNIFFTLALSAFLIMIYEYDKYLSLIVIIILMILEIIFGSIIEYDTYGVIITLLFYINKKIGVLLLLPINILFFGISIEMFAIMSIPLILLHNEEIKNKKVNPYYFFGYYILHIVILYYISILF